MAKPEIPLENEKSLTLNVEVIYPSIETPIKKYSFPLLGYNQALAPVAAVLLMFMPREESFWMLVSICKYYLPGYYDDKMNALKLDGMIFSRLLGE